MSPQPGRKRFEEIDALRGLAALAVMIFHYTWRSEHVLPAARGLSHGLAWGHYGVQLFFAISGFVILMTLNRTATTADFVVARASRLFPPYWAAMFLTTVLVTILGAPALIPTSSAFVINLSMLQGFMTVPAVDGVYWSLGVELIFYCWMWALWRLGLLGRIELMLLLWITLKIAASFDLGPSHLGSIALHEFVPWFAVGVAAYRVHIGDRKWVQQIPLLGYGLLAIGIANSLQLAAIYFATVLILIAAVSGHLRWLVNRPLLWLGTVSYPLYLIHQNAGYAVIAWLERHGASPLFALPCAAAVAFSLAEAIRRWIEQPSLALVRNWWKFRLRSAQLVRP
jgi:peptidoglycan/LPS O-acetylase OafA/YrhL